jgi:hypothetical protein
MELSRILGIARIDPAANRGGLSEQWSAVITIAGYSKIVYGVPFVLSAMAAILATCFACGLVGVLIRLVGLIG